jgi:hypothetical protein
LRRKFPGNEKTKSSGAETEFLFGLSENERRKERNEKIIIPKVNFHTKKVNDKLILIFFGSTEAR